MKRDLDLYRQILFIAEGIDPAEPYLTGVKIEGVDDYVLGEHVRLMKEAGLITAQLVETPEGGAKVYALKRLLGPGHDFLDAVRSDTVWSRTKQRVSSTVGTATLEVVKAVAEAVTRGMIGI